VPLPARTTYSPGNAPTPGRTRRTAAHRRGRALSQTGAENRRTDRLLAVETARRIGRRRERTEQTRQTIPLRDGHRTFTLRAPRPAACKTVIRLAENDGRRNPHERRLPPPVDRPHSTEISRSCTVPEGSCAALSCVGHAPAAFRSTRRHGASSPAGAASSGVDAPSSPLRARGAKFGNVLAFSWCGRRSRLRGLARSLRLGRLPGAW
jgi:hypothetical protein